MGPIFRNILICSVIIGGAGAVSVLLYLNRAEPETVVQESKPLLVDVAEVVKQDVPVTIASQGTVSARTQTTLIAEVSGRVVEVSPKFQAGGLFKAGEMLLQIDDRDYRAAVKRAESAVASARSQLALEKGQADVAYRDWLKFSKGGTRDAEADALAQRKPQLAEAQARLDAAEADLAVAKDNLERTTIRVPYAGMVREKKVDIGQYVTTGSTLGETFAVDRVEVRLPIPDDRLNYLNLPQLGREDSAQAPSVVLSASRGDSIHEWTGRLVRTEGVLDQRSRVLFVVAEVKDPYNLEDRTLEDSNLEDSNLNSNGPESTHAEPLRIGTFVNAQITGKTLPDIVVLPRYVLRTGNQVWVVDESNRLVNRNVKLLRTEGELAYVRKGLENGERVSLSTIPHAVSGTRIRQNSSVKTSALLQSKSTAHAVDSPDTQG